jgi:type VI secretion system protein ImpA
MAIHLNIESLLAPIPGPNPSGENLRYTETYDQINEAKRADDELDRGEWHTELKRSDWALVIKICSEALTHKSKDLQISVWLTEALLHQHGFSGLRFGLSLLSKLISDFWETLHPEIEDDDLDFRAGPLSYLNEKLSSAVFEVPICEPGSTKGYNYYAWEQSRSPGGGQRQEDSADEVKVSAEDFKSAVNMGSIGFYKDLYGQLTECHEKLETLDKIVTQKFVSDPPGLSKVTDAVADCLRVIKRIYFEKKKSEVEEVEDEDSNPDMTENLQQMSVGENNHSNEAIDSGNLFAMQHAISDISLEEKKMWNHVSKQASQGNLKNALDQLIAAAALAPSERQKNRYLLLVAKLCINAGRHDLALPIVEQLYQLIETLNLEQWEHPAWIAEIIEALYRCIENANGGSTDRSSELFQKLCTLNITKAAKFRISSMPKAG